MFEERIRILFHPRGFVNSMIRWIGDLATTTRFVRWVTCAALASSPSMMEVQLVQGVFMFGPYM